MAATRSLVTRTCIPVSFALRRRSGAGMPPAARPQFLDASSNQNGIQAHGSSFDMELARDTLKKLKKREEDMRRGIKWFSRGVKAIEWPCYFGVSYTVAVVMVRKAKG